jgi:isochorismate synthase
MLVAQTQGEPVAVQRVSQLAGHEGFVMAPFEPTPKHPIFVMRADVLETFEVDGEEEMDGCTQGEDDGLGRGRYHDDFERFHTELLSGRVAKLVLSRCVDEHLDSEVDAQALFVRACRMYPHQYIALVSIQGAGTWLMATPEVLLEGDGKLWHTMALAGTMRMGDESEAHLPVEAWSEKNRAEQQYVSRYIEGILSSLTSSLSQQGPYTTMAAHLLHLRTDFTFGLKDPDMVASLLDALHPTPAVCGMPKAEARQFIVAHESVDRKYYSGFCGPLHLQGETHLFVSLRCMEISGAACRLYAGGGLLSESVEANEWQETETKLQTMRRLLGRQ